MNKEKIISCIIRDTELSRNDILRLANEKIKNLNDKISEKGAENNRNLLVN